MLHWYRLCPTAWQDAQMGNPRDVQRYLVGGSSLLSVNCPLLGVCKCLGLNASWALGKQPLRRLNADVGLLSCIQIACVRYCRTLHK